MQYTITKQIAVEAETPEEAVSKIDYGKTISLTVNPRLGMNAGSEMQAHRPSPALAARQTVTPQAQA